MKDKKHKEPERGSEATPHDPATKITAASYLRLARTHLKNGEHKHAFVLLQQAVVLFPEDALILSYFGCLQALVDKKYRSGIETCKRAISLLKKREEEDKEKLYALFHLNLGRAYLAAGKRQDALAAFTTGIKYDSSNRDLQMELRGMGKRKQPPVSFLGRSNPLNKYIGKILHARSKDLEKRQRASR